MVELHRHCSVDRVERANKLLEGFLEETPTRTTSVVHQRLTLFHDKRLRLEHNSRYIDGLLDAKKTVRPSRWSRESLDLTRCSTSRRRCSAFRWWRSRRRTMPAYVDMLLNDFERATRQ